MRAAICSTIGYPRIGGKREMKKALESFWAGSMGADALWEAYQIVFDESLQAHKDAGIDLVGVGDHTLYDHVLDWTLRLGCVPSRFGRDWKSRQLDVYFEMARGCPGKPALDMTKMLNSNYHYLRTELDEATAPEANFQDFLRHIEYAQKKIGSERVAPIVLGPVSFVYLAALAPGLAMDTITRRLLPVYLELLSALAALGVPEVQVHEPALVTETASNLETLYVESYKTLASVGAGLNLVTFFDDLSPAVYQWVVKLPGTSAISLDFTRGSNTDNLKRFGFPKDKRLGAGVVDGRSVWRDLRASLLLANIARVSDNAGTGISVQPSCSLQYVPLDVNLEVDLPTEIRAKLSFAKQKLADLVELTRKGDLSSPGDSGYSQKPATDTNFPHETFFVREPAFANRRSSQFRVPGGFGTTTIRSLPQTKKIRRLRALRRNGQLSEVEYLAQIDIEIAHMIGVQEALGLDVLIHGEPERSDMVEFFAQRMTGFSFTIHGWVQSYGSRYVRPPIVTDDVTRSSAMTVREFTVAQGLTTKPVKGMLTGSTTILNWSFPRKDISLKEQSYQIGLVLREEVLNLEAAGCRIIQVDDPALREGLPLKKKDWDWYLDWAVKSFRLATSGVKPETQIVTHLCYSDFEDILSSIHAMDADVLTIENSRSGDAMLTALAKYGFDRDVGPGVYDIHSPVVPSESEMATRIALFKSAGLETERIWVNPDCGLKSRGWSEVVPALRNMVAAASHARRSSTGV
mmetsp:Transcript_36608/g.89427  ORF Transcript_36608/g.89427 Transcript_36608/m.89427 type:complete len:746 (+) Transcript_36608:210-2447(+)